MSDRPSESDPLGREHWDSVGVDADAEKAVVEVWPSRDEQHRHPYNPTVDGITDEVVYLDIPAAFLTAHDIVAIHDFVRLLRRGKAEILRIINPT